MKANKPTVPITHPGVRTPEVMTILNQGCARCHMRMELFKVVVSTYLTVDGLEVNGFSLLKFCSFEDITLTLEHRF